MQRTGELANHDSREPQCVVGVFASTIAAHDAVEVLKAEGWSPERVSLISPGHESELGSLGNMQQDDQSQKSAAIGGAAGAALGLLAGSSLFIIPGLGPVLFAGAMASGITGGLVGGLLGAMSGWGVEENFVRQYEQALKQGKAIVLLTGDAPALAQGRARLLSSQAETVEMHATPSDSRVDA